MQIGKKNILIPSILAALSWIGVIAAIFVLKPEGIATLVFFFLLLFASIYLSMMVAFSHKRRAVLVASLILSLLLLKYFRLDALINLILTVALFITIEIYFVSQKSRK